MQFATIDIKTPFDSPINYEPNWRFSVASALSTTVNTKIIPGEIVKDNIIIETSRYLKYIKLNGVGIPEIYKNYHTVTLWYEDNEPQAIKFYIEALLLTDRTYCGIADDMDISEDLVKLYEKLFFNIRDKNGKLIKTHPLKMHFAFGDFASVEDIQAQRNKSNFYAEPIEWKVAAVQYGYPMLSAIWGLNKENTIEEAELQYYKTSLEISRELSLKRMMRGSISNFDINSAHNNYINFMRLKHDIEEDRKNLSPGGNSGTIDIFGLKLLQMMAPKMIESVLTVEELEIQDKILQQKLLAESNIKKTDITDHGVTVAVAEMNAGIKDKLQNG